MSVPAPTPSRRAAILEAALAAFTDVGYDVASIEQICSSAPASVGSFYHHFGSKEGVAAALYEEAVRRYQSVHLTTLGSSLEPEPMVVALVLGHMQWVRDNERWAKYLLQMGSAPTTASARTSVRLQNRMLLSAFEAWATPYREAGAIAALPPGALMALILGPSYFATRSWLSGDVELDDAFIRAFAGAAWRAVRTEDGF